VPIIDDLDSSFKVVCYDPIETRPTVIGKNGLLCELASEIARGKTYEFNIEHRNDTNRDTCIYRFVAVQCKNKSYNLRSLSTYKSEATT
jgi:hypothetical protein